MVTPFMTMQGGNNFSNMNYPIFAPNSTWYSQGGTTIKKTTFTNITILDSYSPTGEESESWNADVDNNGDIKCYIKGNELIIAGNGSGKLALNEDSSYMFSDASANTGDGFYKVLYIHGLDILDTSNSKNMSHMFFFCTNLQAILINNWNTNNCENFSSMFRYCSSLSEIDLTNFNTKKSTKMSNMFVAMVRLKKVILGSNFNFSGNGTANPKAMLPTPSINYIKDTDGRWHSENCITYISDSIPNEIKMTYYASPAEVPTTMTIKYGTMFNIANSYRQKAGVNERVSPSALVSGIRSIPQFRFDNIEQSYEIGSDGYIIINRGDLPCDPKKIICINAYKEDNSDAKHLMVYNPDYEFFYFTYTNSLNEIILDTTGSSTIIGASGSISWPIDPNIINAGQSIYIETIGYIEE